MEVIFRRRKSKGKKLPPKPVFDKDFLQTAYESLSSF
jgi:hypothetical protein